jgi:hypothetical protein
VDDIECNKVVHRSGGTEVRAWFEHLGGRREGVLEECTFDGPEVAHVVYFESLASFGAELSYRAEIAGPARFSDGTAQWSTGHRHGVQVRRQGRPSISSATDTAVLVRADAMEVETVDLGAEAWSTLTLAQPSGEEELAIAVGRASLRLRVRS